MANIVVISDLVDSMEKAVYQLEKATADGNKNEMTRLRIQIMDNYKKIDEALSGKNV